MRRTIGLGHKNARLSSHFFYIVLLLRRGVSTGCFATTPTPGGWHTRREHDLAPNLTHHPVERYLAFAQAVAPGLVPDAVQNDLAQVFQVGSLAQGG